MTILKVDVITHQYQRFYLALFEKSCVFLISLALWIILQSLPQYLHVSLEVDEARQLYILRAVASVTLNCCDYLDATFLKQKTSNLITAPQYVNVDLACR